jgi:hypothetical protein
MKGLSKKQKKLYKIMKQLPMEQVINSVVATIVANKILHIFYSDMKEKKKCKEIRKGGN